MAPAAPPAGLRRCLARTAARLQLVCLLLLAAPAQPLNLQPGRTRRGFLAAPPWLAGAAAAAAAATTVVTNIPAAAAAAAGEEDEEGQAAATAASRTLEANGGKLTVPSAWERTPSGGLRDRISQDPVASAVTVQRTPTRLARISDLGKVGGWVVGRGQQRRPGLCQALLLLYCLLLNSTPVSTQLPPCSWTTYCLSFLLAGGR